MGVNPRDIAVWWLVLELIGLAAFPIASQLARNVKDNGYSISKPLGLLLLTYLSWVISIFSGYSYFSVLLSIGIIGICSSVICISMGKPQFDKKYLIRFELLFAAAFVIFAVIRAYSPDIYWTGGEKFMDMSFINSILRTSEFPPLDPWMSGTLMYYYYFGYLIVADLIKITSIYPSAAFNLSTASFFALAFTTAFGIGYNLTEKMKYGIITAFLVTIAGNPVGFFQMIEILSGKGEVINKLLSFNYWTASRVIPNTINEFPFFSFLHGDVHAHMISITFQLLVIFLLLNIIKSGTLELIPLLALGLAAGFLYPLNTWDYPVYLFLSIAIIGCHALLSKNKHFKSTYYFKTIMAIGAVAVSSYLLYLPYHISYKLEKTISFVSAGRTQLVYYLTVYGVFLYLISWFIISKSKKSFHRQLYLISAFILLSILSIVLRFELLILLVPLLLLSVVSMLKEGDNNRIFVIILIITGVLLSLFCELFYIKDALGDANPAYIRLNTLFKLYLDNWILWGVSAGYAIFEFRDSFSRKKIWGIIAIVLILMVSVYPVFATIGKSGIFRGENSLDGEMYVKKMHPQEYMAILWFRNISGQPVVLQAPGDLYQWNTYITTFTGLPTVIGWAGHELNWRFPYRQEIDARWSDVNTMYTSLSVDEVDALLKQYNVSYIYFGEAERKRYSSPVLFDSHSEMFEKVFEYGDVVVYGIRYTENG